MVTIADWPGNGPPPFVALAHDAPYAEFLASFGQPPMRGHARAGATAKNPASPLEITGLSLKPSAVSAKHGPQIVGSLKFHFHDSMNLLFCKDFIKNNILTDYL
jgi:hypothetical protein